MMKLELALHASVGALPDFLTPEQCAQYNKEHAGVATSPQEPTVFFTGKPYVDGLGYVFKYRNYNPELCRWQSADPSGFPDGANNQIYAPVPTSGVDPNGLFYNGTPYTGYLADELLWDLIEQLSSYYPMAVTAMEHADGTIPGNWILSSANTSEIENTDEYQDIYRQTVQTALGSSPSPGAFSTQTPPGGFLFTKPDDAYYTFGHADISTSGTVYYNSPVDGVWTYYATVTISKYYTFATESAASFFTPTGLGYRLQTAGYIQPFSINGTWPDSWTE